MAVRCGHDDPDHGASRPSLRPSPGGAAGACGRRDLSARLSHRHGAAAGRCPQLEFLRLRGPRQRRRHPHRGAADRGLCRSRRLGQRRGAQEAGHHARGQGAGAVRRRQGFPGDRPPGPREHQGPQMDPGRLRPAAHRAGDGADPRQRARALSRRRHARGAPHRRGARVRADRGATRPAAVHRLGARGLQGGRRGPGPRGDAERCHTRCLDHQRRRARSAHLRGGGAWRTDTSLRARCVCPRRVRDHPRHQGGAHHQCRAAAHLEPAGLPDHGRGQGSVRLARRDSGAMAALRRRRLCADGRHRAHRHLERCLCTFPLGARRHRAEVTAQARSP